MKLPHAVVASAQVGLSYLIFVGYFAIVAAEAAKHLAPGTASSLKDVVMLCAAFWFMRQRASTDPSPPENPK